MPLRHLKQVQQLLAVPDRPLWFRLRDSEPGFDPRQAAFEIIEPVVHCGEVDQPLFKPGVDSVEALFEAGKSSAQKIEDFGVVAHSGPGYPLDISSEAKQYRSRSKAFNKRIREMISGSRASSD